MPTVLGLTNDSKTSSSDPNSSSLIPSSSSGGPVQATAKMGNDSFVSKNKPLANPDRLNTISKRNHAAALEIETLLWRALCDKPEKAKEYMADDVVMINPFFNHGSSQPVSKKTDPSIEEVLEGNDKWVGFRFDGDPLVVEIDLMAVALVYRMRLFRQSSKGNGLREVKATCSSSWRQTAGADWLLCAMHVAYDDDDDGDE